MKFGYIVHLQLFYKKIQNIDTFIKNEFVQRSYIINNPVLDGGEKNVKKINRVKYNNLKMKK